MNRAGAFACVATVIVASPARHAHAESRVVVVAASLPSRLLTRTESEVRASALDATRLLLPAGTPLGPEELAKQARATRASAVLRVSSTGIEVWIASPPGGRLAFVETVTEDAHDEASEGVAALRATEIVQAALGPEASLPGSPAVGGETAPRGPVPVRAQGRFRAHLSPWFAVSPGGVGPMFGAQASLGINVGDHVRVDVLGSAPLSSAVVRRSEGEARVRIMMVGTTISYAALAPHARLRPHVASGVSLALLGVEGRAAAPFEARAGDAAAPCVWVGAGATLRISPSLAARAEADFGMTTSRLRVNFAGRSQAEWGRGAVSTTVGAEVSF